MNRLCIRSVLAAASSFVIAASAAAQTAAAPSEPSADCLGCVVPSGVQRPAAKIPRAVADAYAHIAPTSIGSIPRRVNGALGGAFIGGLAGVLIGAVIGDAVWECVDGPCLGGLGGAIIGGGIGIVAGAIVGYLVTDEEPPEAR